MTKLRHCGVSCKKASYGHSVNGIKVGGWVSVVNTEGPICKAVSHFLHMTIINDMPN